MNTFNTSSKSKQIKINGGYIIENTKYDLASGSIKPYYYGYLDSGHIIGFDKSFDNIVQRVNAYAETLKYAEAIAQVQLEQRSHIHSNVMYSNDVIT